MNLFGVRKVDERSWQHFRAAQVLGEAVSGGRLSQPAALCCGHVAAVTSSAAPRSLLLCFDAAPLSRHPSDDDVAQLRSLLLQQPASASSSSSSAAAAAPASLSVQRAALASPLRVAWVGFLPPAAAPAATPLRLCAADATGTLFVWEFAPDDSAWIAVGSCTDFFAPFAPAACTVVYDLQRSTFVWTTPADASAVFARSVAFEARPNPKLPGRRNMAHTVAPGPVPTRRTELGSSGPAWRALPLAAADVGMWLVHEETLAVRLFSFRTQTLIAAPAVAVPHHHQQQKRMLHSCAVHNLTGELVVIDATGVVRAFALSADGTAVTETRLCELGELPAASPEGCSLAVVRHSICIATAKGCRFYDLLCGVRTGEVVFPASVSLQQSPPQFLGPAPGDAASHTALWWPGTPTPMLQIVWPSPTAYAELLVSTAVAAAEKLSGTAEAEEDEDEEGGSAKRSSPTALLRDSAALAAVSVCSDWGLDQWVAQNAFDLLLKGLPHKNAEQVARALSARLQNPALVVSLLSSRNMAGFVEEEISRFLSSFSAASGDARAAYQAFTPLNTKVYADLLRYLQLLRAQEQGCRLPGGGSSIVAEDVHSSCPLSPSEVPADRLLSLDTQTLFRLSEEHPQPFCDKLLVALGLRISDIERFSSSSSGVEEPPVVVHPALLQEEPHAPGSSTPAREVGAKAAARQPQGMFELCCTTLFACNPRLLPSFVALVTTANQHKQQQQQQQQRASQTQQPPQAFSKKRSFAERALLAIPLTVLEGSAPEHQTTAAAMLLAMSGRAMPALLLLLRAGLWDSAVQLLSADPDPAHNPELFSALLHNCLQAHRLDRLADLWKFAPPQLTALDIVNAVAMHTTQNEAPVDITVVNPSKQFPLGAFKPALLELVRRHSTKAK